MNQLHLQEAVSLLRSLPNESVDFICVDPPYHTTALAFDKGQRIDWQLWWTEANRVLKPAGVVCIFAASAFTFAMHAANPKAWRYNLIWQKTRWSCYQHANLRPLQAHEDILVFCRQPKKATYNPQKTPSKGVNKTKRERHKPAGRSAHLPLAAHDYKDDGLRHPGTVLHFASGDNSRNINPTQKPVPLVRWLIRTYSNPGDVVVDTCAGSGTTAIACQEEGRQWICSEIDPDQYAKAAKRIAENRPQLHLLAA